MVRRLLSSPASLFSVTKFAEELKSQGIAVGRDTLYEFLDHLEDAFLLGNGCSHRKNTLVQSEQTGAETPHAHKSQCCELAGG